jgi:hypothetical protein
MYEVSTARVAIHKKNLSNVAIFHYHLHIGIGITMRMVSETKAHLEEILV